MAKPVFTWNPDNGHTCIVKPSVNTTKFGDGYELRVPTGINSQPESWDLRFTKNRTEMVALRDFLKARGGVESFTWTNPHNETKTYVAHEGWSETTVEPSLIVLSVKFDQVFEV